MTPNTFHHEVKKDTMRVGLGILCVLISIGTLFFHIIEGHTIFDSLYFIIITMTTVGYGDFVPMTTVGKILTMIYAITGAPLFIFMAGFVIEQRITGVVKSYIKHHSSQLRKLETTLDTISESVESIDEQINEEAK